MTRGFPATPIRTSAKQTHKCYISMGVGGIANFKSIQLKYVDSTLYFKLLTSTQRQAVDSVSMHKEYKNERRPLNVLEVIQKEILITVFLT